MKREIRPVFARFLELEAVPDSDTQEGKETYRKAGEEMDRLWSELTPAEKYYHESGHRWPSETKLARMIRREVP